MPPLPSASCADLWWFDIRSVHPGPADLADLDEAEQAKAGSFAFAADRRRYQAAHVALRRVLSGYLDVPPGRLVVGRVPCPQCGGPDGRPVLAGPDGPQFSLAHSGNAVLVAVAAQPVGADVEQEPRGCMCSMTSAMHRGDASVITVLPEPERHEAIIRWWVRAEAVLKCTGEGIAHGLDGFPVVSGPAGAPVHGCSVDSVDSPPGYRAAIALAGAAGVTKLTVRAAWPQPAGG
jgi:4'-phosphopantetheinyl transferase